MANRKRKRNAKRKNVQTGKGVNVFVMANRLGTVIESRYKIGEIKSLNDSLET